MRHVLADAINRMPDRERLVLTLYYYEALTLAEIGKVLGVTESRVCQIHTKAILQLRGRLIEPPRRTTPSSTATLRCRPRRSPRLAPGDSSGRFPALPPSLPFPLPSRAREASDGAPYPTHHDRVPRRARVHVGDRVVAAPSPTQQCPPAVRSLDPAGRRPGRPPVRRAEVARTAPAIAVPTSPPRRARPSLAAGAGRGRLRRARRRDAARRRRARRWPGDLGLVPRDGRRCASAAVVTRGTLLGTAGGTGPEHAVGVVHFALRVRGEYVDPMRLFVAVDLTEAVHLAPLRHRPAQRGLDPPRRGARLARSLRLPQRIPGLEPVAGRRPLGPRDGRRGRRVRRRRRASVEFLGRPLVAHVAHDRAATPLGPALEDLHSMASRFVAYVRSRADCTDPHDRPRTGRRGLGAPARSRSAGSTATPTHAPAPRSVSTRRRSATTPTRSAGSRTVPAAARTARRTPGRIWSGRRTACATSSRAFARAHPGREVDLVAHSQGGVVVDAFLELAYDPADPTLPPLGTVVTLSSPHQGAPLAEVAADMRSSPAGRRAARRRRATLPAARCHRRAGRPPASSIPRSPFMRQLRRRTSPTRSTSRRSAAPTTASSRPEHHQARRPLGHHRPRRPRRPLRDRARPPAR